tara:strand:- start:8516 stop:8842 length:327 start_codon:yes stop_codon:yes gene_type:complete
MANTFKLKTKSSVGTTPQNVYVVPAATTTTIIGISLANISGTGINVSIGVDRPVGDNVKLLKDAPVPQGSTLEFMQGNKVVLETGDTLTCESDVNNSIDVSVTLMEMT